ncbi:MAG: hypothetical protein HY329_26325, partial [Chloroflexi bacterium]|nr:hypothetical protein [Chloroflexota bacterium]
MATVSQPIPRTTAVPRVSSKVLEFIREMPLLPMTIIVFLVLMALLADVIAPY